MVISDAEDALDDEELDCPRRSGRAELLDGGEIGTESTMSCPLVKALERKGSRSSNGTSE